MAKLMEMLASRVRQVFCRHQRTKLFQIGYGGGYVCQCLDCRRVKGVTR